MKTGISRSFAIAGISTLLLAGCVSSKKYKASQAELQRVRSDSAQLAQQVSSLNQNVQTIQQKNTALQQSLDSTSRNYTSSQQSLDYYQTYFTKQQTSITQISQELKDALSQAGLTDQDLQQMNGAVYVSLNENNIFKNNSTTVSTKGQQALNSLAQVLKNHTDVDVTVDNDVPAASADQTTTGTSGMSNNSTSYNSTGNSTTTSTTGYASTRTRRPAQSMARSKSKTSNTTDASTQNSTSQASPNTADAQKTTPSRSSGAQSGNSTAKVHRKAPRKSSGEGAVTYSNNAADLKKLSAKTRASYTLKTGRVNTVAKHLLQGGLPKLNVAVKQPASYNNATQSNNIKVIISPVMADFNPPQKTNNQ